MKLDLGVPLRELPGSIDELAATDFSKYHPSLKEKVGKDIIWSLEGKVWAVVSAQVRQNLGFEIHGWLIAVFLRE